MKVLLTTINDGSFLHPLITLGWALRTSGHEVMVACQEYAVPHVVQAGLTAVSVSRQTSPDRLLTAFRVTPEMLEDARPGLHPPYDLAEHPERARWNDLVAGYAEDVERSRYENFPVIGRLTSLTRSWRPDLVIWEPFTVAGAIAAKACGAANARLLFGIDVFGVTRQAFLRLSEAQPENLRSDPLADWLGSYARKYGFEFTEDMVCGHFTIDQYPPGLQMAAPGLTYLHGRYVPYGGMSTVPPWLHTPPRRPRVALTMGFTAGGFFHGYGFNLQHVLSELADLNIEVVAVVDDGERAKLSALPANVRLLSWVPLDALAATCSAVVNHAGGGTLSTFAARGVPQLTIPNFADRYQFAIQHAGLSYQTLRNYAWVSRRFPTERRRAKLSFRHHAEVASLQVEEQERLLDLAECEQWTTKQLRNAIQRSREGLSFSSQPEANSRLAFPRGRIKLWREAAQQAGVDFEEWILAELDRAASDVLVAA